MDERISSDTCESPARHAVSESRRLKRTLTLCAALFRVVRSINVSLGPKEDRVLTTGLHTVCDIFCVTCEENIGE